MKMQELRVMPALDRAFQPAIVWHRAYRAACEEAGNCRDIVIGLGRPDGTMFRHEMRILPPRPEWDPASLKAVERTLKFLLWHKGGSRIYIAGAADIGRAVQRMYDAGGRRAFDWDVMGRRMFGETMRVVVCDRDAIPPARETASALGRRLRGCRIGFDLGGSDRKAAAVIDGKVVFSEEIKWDPYFQSDPRYHYEGIQDSLRRAAAHLPRVDAIGGSAAGDYVDNEPRVASLFRGVSEEDFNRHVRGIFKRIRAEWNNVPFEVANDGEVTALAGSMAIDDNALLGISMGTSQAAGYCDRDGHITAWLNELAFAPIDYREDAPADEWSGDIGCGVQYFSQQAVARLMPAAGISVDPGMPLPDRLAEVQNLMAAGDGRARKIYETIGAYLGYAVGRYAEFYELRHVMLLGRVTSGPGGDVMIDNAARVLAAECPDLHRRLHLFMPDEKMKRHGQAIAAASLPRLPGES